MRRATAIIIKTVIIILALIGLLALPIIIQWWPVVDRVYIRPCAYYPQAFADCQ